MKSCTQNYFKAKRGYLILAASGASYQNVRGATLHGGSNDTNGGRVRLRRPETSPICPNLQKEQSSVVNTVPISAVKNLSAVSLTPVNNLWNLISQE